MKQTQEDVYEAKTSPKDLLAAFQAQADRFRKAEDPTLRNEAAEHMLALWNRLHGMVAKSPLASERLSVAADLADGLKPAAVDEDDEARTVAVDLFSDAFERIADSVAAIGTAREPGAAWRPKSRPLAPEEKAARLEKAQARTRRTAETLTEAIRKVLEVRREEGVPLYATSATEAQAAYATAAGDYAMGLVAAPPPIPAVIPQTAPWGVFRVRSSVPPAEAAERFDASPPLPQRVELMEPRIASVRFAPLHELADGESEMHNSGGPTDAHR